MMKLPSSASFNCPTSKYIGSDFDKVIIVADNMELITKTSESLEELNEISKDVINARDTAIQASVNAKSSEEKASNSEREADDSAITCIKKAEESYEWSKESERFAKIAETNAGSTFRSGGIFTPTSSEAYPDVTGIRSSMLYIFNTNARSYSYTSGDLSGEVVYSGDQLYYDIAQNKFKLVQVPNMIRIFDLMFPVNHILITFNYDNPISYGYMGTWELLEPDAVLMSSNTVSQISAIGSNLVDVPLLKHTHGAVLSESGSHTHNTRSTTGTGASGIANQSRYSYVSLVDEEVSNTSGTHTHNLTIGSSGDEGAKLDVSGKRYKVAMWVRTK